MCNFLKLPVPANQPHPFSLPVGEQKSQRSHTITCQIPLHEQSESNEMITGLLINQN